MDNFILMMIMFLIVSVVTLIALAVGGLGELAAIGIRKFIRKSFNK